MSNMNQVYKGENLNSILTPNLWLAEHLLDEIYDLYMKSSHLPKHIESGKDGEQENERTFLWRYSESIGLRKKVIPMVYCI